MTQKALAQQLAEMRNNMLALDKLLKAPYEPKQEPERIVSEFLITYKDGTSQKFGPIGPLINKTSTDDQVKEILAKTKARHLPNQPVLSTLPRPGFGCNIDGKTYASVMQASRELGLCRHRVKANLDKGLFGWKYV